MCFFILSSFYCARVGCFSVLCVPAVVCALPLGVFFISRQCRFLLASLTSSYIMLCPRRGLCVHCLRRFVCESVVSAGGNTVLMLFVISDGLSRCYLLSVAAWVWQMASTIGSAYDCSLCDHALLCPTCQAELLERLQHYLDKCILPISVMLMTAHCVLSSPIYLHRT